MTKYCIVWKNSRKETHIGPPLTQHLTEEEAQEHATKMNLTEDFPSHHWPIQYKGREWKEINEKSTQTAIGE